MPLAPILVSLLLSGCAAPQVQSPAGTPTPKVAVETLAIPVSAAENRAVSFTNKRSAFYYTQSHRNDHPEHAYFRGYNIAGRRIFGGYRLYQGEQLFEPLAATVVVHPDALVRRFPQDVTATLRLFDRQDALEIEIESEVAATPAASLRLELEGDTLARLPTAGGIDWYTSRQDGDAAGIDFIAVGPSDRGFLIAVGSSREAAGALLEQARLHAVEWHAARAARVAAVLNGEHYVSTDDPRLTSALRWLSLTTDSLVTEQRGAGIYAGLPWFNEYWGRDSFISLPGATLVTGRFEEARAVLTSFARFQELDRNSRFYGRMPNIVKPGSIDYHTTDGTPRWVIALRDYVRYTGDRTLIAELYPNVQASIDGALLNFTDASGFLVHADNETWMDARREPDKVSYSPRSTRANDIQALWYEQLRAGVEFAQTLRDEAAAARWSAAAERLRSSFARDFVDTASSRMADHLDAQGVPNFQVRPNALFALSLVDQPEVAARILRTKWQALVYPWGVATLDQADPGFHPYHVAPERYHKDAAYHNGAVWPWLNGIAMQRMLEMGQTELAWQLFTHANEIALTRGVVGGLPENLDAYPHPGESAPRLTGTYLQGWSNAEQLRTWYQGVLGVQPEMQREVLGLVPRLPQAFGTAEFVARIGAGRLHGRYEPVAQGRRYTWRLEDVDATLEIDIAPFTPQNFVVAAGDSLIVEQRPHRLTVQHLDAAGRRQAQTVVTPDADRSALQTRLDAILASAVFAQPGKADAHPAMQR